jgi:hypothetical protein
MYISVDEDNDYNLAGVDIRDYINNWEEYWKPIEVVRTVKAAPRVKLVRRFPLIPRKPA